MFQSLNGLLPLRSSNAWPVVDVPRLAALGAQDDGLPTQLAMLKQAPPPSRKMRSLCDAGVGLMPSPVALPSRHCVPSTGTGVHVFGGALIGSPFATVIVGDALGWSVPGLEGSVLG